MVLVDLFDDMAWTVRSDDRVQGHREQDHQCHGGCKTDVAMDVQHQYALQLHRLIT